MAQIGAGCSGRVYRAVWRGQPVAVKAICHDEVMAQEEQVRVPAAETRPPRGADMLLLCKSAVLLPHSCGCKDRFTEGQLLMSHVALGRTAPVDGLATCSPSCPQVQAIEREAALGICLDHPNVVAIYAAYTTVATVTTVSRRALTVNSRQQPALSAPAGPAQKPQQQQHAALAAAEAASAGGGSSGVTAGAAAATVGRSVSVGGCAPRVETFIIMELCTHGSLREALDNKRLHDRRGAPKMCEVGRGAPIQTLVVFYAYQFQTKAVTLYNAICHWRRG